MAPVAHPGTAVTAVVATPTTGAEVAVAGWRMLVRHAVALGGVDGEDAVHLRADLVAVHGGHVHGRPHEGHRVVRFGRGIGADVGGNDDVPLEAIPGPPHLEELRRCGQRGNGPVGVRDQADGPRSGPDPAQAADDAEGGGNGGPQAAWAGALGPRAVPGPGPAS